jgi:hypothetical protein
LSTRSSPSPASLRLELRGSRTLCAALVILAGAGLAAIALTALPLAPRLLLAAVLVVHLAVLLQRQRLLCGVLSWREDGWRWVDGAGECPLQLRAATLWPGLVVLQMRERPAGRSRVFAVLADSSDRDAQRRLRACLRYMPVFEAVQRPDR